MIVFGKFYVQTFVAAPKKQVREEMKMGGGGRVPAPFAGTDEARNEVDEESDSFTIHVFFFL